MSVVGPGMEASLSTLSGKPYQQRGPVLKFRTEFAGGVAFKSAVTSANRLRWFQVAVLTTTPQSRVGTRYGCASGAGSPHPPKDKGPAPH